MVKKVRIIAEGKQFEAYLKAALTIEENGVKRLIGIAYAGGITACRAIHAALYNEPQIEIFDEQSGRIEQIMTGSSYRRIEEIDGKVCHTFALPRSSVIEDYQESVADNIKNEIEEMPARTLIAPNGNIEEVVGAFLAETFGLPKKADWRDQYLSILPPEKVQHVSVNTTKLAGRWVNMKAIHISPMSEEEILKHIENAIVSGKLETKDDEKPKSLKEYEAMFVEDMTTEEYLRTNAQAIALKISTYLRPLYNGRYFKRSIAETNRISVPAQARAVMAAYEVLKKKNGVFLVGDMGTGKTQMALSTIYTKARERENSGAKDGMRCLIVAPANVCPKWATSEIPQVIPKEKIITTMINSTEDALRYANDVRNGYTVPKGKIEFVIVSTDRMKLTAQRFVLGARWNHRRMEWTSPNTGLPLRSPKNKKDEVDLIAGWSDVVSRPDMPPTHDEIQKAKANGTLGKNGVPLGYIKRWNEAIRSFQDDYDTDTQTDCSLARPAQKKWAESRGGHRWMIAQIFQRLLRKYFHIGIFDEIQQMKALDSGRGAAFHKLLKSCRKSMFLTGTLTNGESSSIFATLWRAFPRELIEAGFSHNTSAETWASRYGVIERTMTRDDGDTNVGVTTNRRKNRVIVKEKPGIAPQLVANHLLDKSIFLDLADLKVPLVEIEEKPIIIELDEDHKDEYEKFHSELHNSCVKLQREIGAAAWSKFNPSTLNYADQPSLGASIDFIDRAEDQVIANVSAPAFPKDYETAKERKLVQLVEDELAQDRPCIIFNNFTGATGEYKTNERIKKVLANHGIESQILNERVSTNDRFDWLQRQEKKGTKVLIMNMRLVEVGLDLMHYPTIIYFQLNDDINTLRQSSRRAWRLGQHKKCKVIYLVNNGTQQMAQFQRLMSRRVSAMIVEGRIERSDDLAKYADVSVSALTNDLSKTLEANDIASAWEEAAKRDIDENLELVSEEKFQERIVEAFEELTAETKQLCGYIDPVEPELSETERAFAELDGEVIDEVLAMFDALNGSEIDAIFEEEKSPKSSTQQRNHGNERSFNVDEDDSYEGSEQLDLFAFA